MKPKKLNPVQLRDDMIMAAVESGVNKHEVARNFGLSRSTIYGILEKMKKDSPVISEYRAQRADVNAWNQVKRQEKQVEVLESITEEDIKSADLKTKMVMLNTLGLDKSREFEQERLERGESTENVAVIVAAIKDLKRRRENGKKEIENT